MANYRTIITEVGQAKLATAIATGPQVNFTTMAVGDSNGVGYDPAEQQTALVNSVYSRPLDSVEVTSGGVITVEMTIPASSGGYHVREAGVFDDDNDMIAIVRISDRYKPLPSSGQADELTIRAKLDVGNVGAVTWDVDLTKKAKIDGQLRPDFRSAFSIRNDPQSTIVPGRTWIVGTDPTGVWAGHENELAEWSGTGWTFVNPTPWMLIGLADKTDVRWDDSIGKWVLFSIHSSMTLTVASSGADYREIQDAIDALSNARIGVDATVTISVAAGNFDPFILDHPDGDRIRIIGEVQTSRPVLTPGVIGTRSAFRASYPTRITSVGEVDGGRVLNAGVGLIANIYFESDGASDNNAGLFFSCIKGRVENCGFCAWENANSNGNAITIERGLIRSSGIDAAWCDQTIRTLNSGASVDIADGIYPSRLAYCETGLFGAGVMLMDDGSIINATTAGIRGSSGASISAIGTTFSGNALNVWSVTSEVTLKDCNLGTASGGTSLSAIRIGRIIDDTSTGDRSSSPTFNTVGNNNSYIARI